MMRRNYTATAHVFCRETRRQGTGAKCPCECRIELESKRRQSTSMADVEALRAERDDGQATGREMGL